LSGVGTASHTQVNTNRVRGDREGREDFGLPVDTDLVYKVRGEAPSSLNDLLRGSRGTLEPFDSTAELWWEDLDALAAATSTPDGMAAGLTLLEGEVRFIDLVRSSLWLGEEVELIP
jgi:hypothetical protein